MNENARRFWKEAYHWRLRTRGVPWWRIRLIEAREWIAARWVGAMWFAIAAWSLGWTVYVLRS